MLKIIKEKLPTGCIFVEKSDIGPTFSPLENKKISLAIKFLEGPEGVLDESYVIVDKKLLNPVFMNAINGLIKEMGKTEDKLRFDDEVVVLKEDDQNKLVSLDIDDDYSIVGEKVAGKLTNLSFSELSNFANFPNRGVQDGPVLVKTVGGSYKPSGESSYFDKLDKKNETLKKWNISNKKFLEENNIPYAPEEKHGFLEGLKKTHSLTSSVAGSLSDVGVILESIDKLKNWWDEYKIKKGYQDEEDIKRSRTMERRKLSEMFLRSRLKKVEDDGFESMSILVNIYNMGYSNILKSPHYFHPEYLKVLFAICSICVANMLPPNRIINNRMNISQLSVLLNKLEAKYGKVVK